MSFSVDFNRSWRVFLISKLTIDVTVNADIVKVIMQWNQDIKQMVTSSCLRQNALLKARIVEAITPLARNVFREEVKKVQKYMEQT